MIPIFLKGPIWEEQCAASYIAGGTLYRSFCGGKPAGAVYTDFRQELIVYLDLLKNC